MTPVPSPFGCRQPEPMTGLHFFGVRFYHSDPPIPLSCRRRGNSPPFGPETSYSDVLVRPQAKPNGSTASRSGPRDKTPCYLPCAARTGLHFKSTGSTRDEAVSHLILHHPLQQLRGNRSNFTIRKFQRLSVLQTGLGRLIPTWVRLRGADGVLP